MNRATSLTVIAIGAIFAFAITASPSFLNLQVVGWILMATGVAGLLLGRRSRDWVRRTVITRGPPDISRFNRRRRTQLETPTPAQPRAQGPVERPAQRPTERPAQRPAEPPSADRPAQPTQPRGEPVERETIEEYIEQ